ncbi:MAG: energy transducer TonB [Methylobacter sp.]|nr:energy transducer TonB [Methylobacter sp.]
MFTKLLLTWTGFGLVERSSATALSSGASGGIDRAGNHSPVALGLVLCAHVAAVAALLPQPVAQQFEKAPETIAVSLVNVQQPAPPQPKALAEPVQKIQKQTKPVKKQAKPKPLPVIHKTPVSKLVAPRIETASHAITPPVEQTPEPPAATSSPRVEPATSAPGNKPAESQAFQSPSFNAAYLHNPPPVYPNISRRLGEQGRVLLSVQVLVDGTAGSVALKNGSGSSRLDQAALEAVKKWRFISAKQGEKPVEAWVVVPVSFSLEG